jgi:serine O-acetyltransferase
MRHSLHALRADTHRQFGRYSAPLLLKGFLTRRNFRPIVTLRLCQAAQNQGATRLLLPLLKIAHRLCTHLAAIDFSWQTKIGGGLAITHGWGLVISPGAIIGANVTLFHGVTLGRHDRIAASGERESGYPVIEDEVWIGPHTIIVGGITIGRGSRIGGGAFVNRDVPPYSVVSGNPGTIVRGNCTPDVPNPAP